MQLTSSFQPLTHLAILDPHNYLPVRFGDWNKCNDGRSGRASRSTSPANCNLSPALRKDGWESSEARRCVVFVVARGFVSTIPMENGEESGAGTFRGRHVLLQETNPLLFGLLTARELLTTRECTTWFLQQLQLSEAPQTPPSDEENPARSTPVPNETFRGANIPKFKTSDCWVIDLSLVTMNSSWHLLLEYPTMCLRYLSLRTTNPLRDLNQFQRRPLDVQTHYEQFQLQNYRLLRNCLLSFDGNKK